MIDSLVDCGFIHHVYYSDNNGEETFYRYRVEGEQELSDLISHFGEYIDEEKYPLQDLYFLIEVSEDVEIIRYHFAEKKSGGITVASETIDDEQLIEYLETFLDFYEN